MAVAHAGLSEKALVAQLKRLTFLQGFEDACQKAVVPIEDLQC